jgi:hypothetical protein
VRQGEGSLRYRAAAACPSQRAVAQEVRARAPAADPSRIAIDIRGGADGYVGVLILDDEPQSQREIRGDRCDDIASALALIAALALDRDGSDGSDGQNGSDRPVGSDGPKALAAAQPAPAQPAPDLAAIAADERLAAPRSPPPSPWRWQLSTAASVAHGVSPGAMLTASLGFQLERRGVAHVWLAAVAGREATSSPMGEVTFLWTTSRGGVCWRPPAPDSEAELCGDLELGRLRVDAGEAVRALTADRLWAAVGGHLGVTWPKTGRGFGQLQAGFAVPLSRDHLYLTPRVDIHTTDPVIPWLSIGGGVRFP